MDISLPRGFENLAEFTSRTFLPTIGGAIGTVALAPIPYGSLLGSALGSAYALKIHQQNFEGRIQYGALVATAGIALLSGGLAMSALMAGGVGTGLIARSAINIFLGSLGRAGDAWDDGEADTAWSWTQKVFLNSSVLGDLVLGEAAHRVFGPLHAEARPAYRERLLQKGHLDPNFESHLTMPFDRPSASDTAGYYLRKTYVSHLARSAYWRWAGRWDDRGGLVGYADTALGICRRNGVQFHIDSAMKTKMAECFKLAQSSNRSLMVIFQGHNNDLDIPVFRALCGLPEQGFNVRMGTKPGQSWLVEASYDIYKTFLLDREDPRTAIEMIKKVAREGRSGRALVAPGIFVQGSMGLGVGPLKSGAFHAIEEMEKTPLVACMTLLGTQGHNMRKPSAVDVYAGFDFFDPLKLSVIAGQKNETVRESLMSHARDIAYDFHTQHWTEMAKNNPTQFYRQMAQFYPLVSGLAHADRRIKEALYSAHVADPKYIREIIMPFYSHKAYVEGIVAQIQRTPLSFEFLNKNIRKLERRVEVLNKKYSLASEGERSSIQEKITRSTSELALFKGPVREFMDNLEKK